MKILFAISILSFFVLAWAVFSVSRKVRQTQGSPIEEAGEVHIPSSPKNRRKPHRTHRTARA